MMTVVLHGGPDSLDRIVRTPGVEIPEQVTVDFYGRHEHFTRTGEVEPVEGVDLPVYQWSYSTAIAE